MTASIQTVYSVLATCYNTSPSVGGPTEWQLPGVVDCPVRCIIDSYTPTGLEAAGSTICMFTDGKYKVLPAGANILWMDFWMASSTSGLTCSVGDSALATRYGSALTGFATATPFRVMGSASGAPYVIGTNAATTGPGTSTPGTASNGDNQIVLTTGGSALSSSTSIIGAILYYTLTC